MSYYRLVDSLTFFVDCFAKSDEKNVKNYNILSDNGVNGCSKRTATKKKKLQKPLIMTNTFSGIYSIVGFWNLCKPF